MMCSDPKKVKEYSKYEELKQKTADNNGITLEDFYELCKTAGFDSKTSELIKVEFERRGLVIDSYQNGTRHR